MKCLASKNGVLEMENDQKREDSCNSSNSPKNPRGIWNEIFEH